MFDWFGKWGWWGWLIFGGLVLFLASTLTTPAA